jgi:DNA polymerase III psi subunit
MPINISKLDFFDNELFPLPPTDKALESCIGQNKKGILIVAADTEKVSEETIAFLRKVLAAVNCHLEEDTTFLNTTTPTSLQFIRIRKNISFSKAMIFGLPPQQLGLFKKISTFQPINAGGVQWLFAPELEKIMADQRLKGALWEGMKEVFGDK